MMMMKMHASEQMCPAHSVHLLAQPARVCHCSSPTTPIHVCSVCCDHASCSLTALRVFLHLSTCPSTHPNHPFKALCKLVVTAFIITAPLESPTLLLTATVFSQGACGEKEDGDFLTRWLL